MATRLTMERLEERALMAADDFGSDFSSAFPVALDGTGSGRVAAEIEEDADIDAFRFVAPADGLLAVRLEAVPGGALDTYLEIYDEIDDGLVSYLTDNDDVAPGLLNSRVGFVAEAGKTYYVLAQGTGVSSGKYTLTFEGPQPITPAVSGPMSLPGTIEEGSDLDLYRVVAPVEGVLEVRLDRAPGSSLDALLTLDEVDEQGVIVPRTDGDDDGVRDGLMRFAAAAGQTYYLVVSAFDGASTGDYTLTLALADPPADLPGEQAITLPPSGPAIRPASIEVAGEVNAFRFVAPRSGGITIRQDAVPGSGLDSALAVFEIDAEGTRRPIAASDDSRGTRDSLVRIHAVAGRTYAIQAAGFGASTGPYTLTIVPDDFGDDFDSAWPLTLSPTVSLVQPGTIDADGDVDVFQFMAPTTGQVTLRQEAATGSDLDSLVFVFDEAGRLIAFGDDGADRLAPKNSLLEFDVEQGRRYFVRAGAFPSLTAHGRFGAYRLSLGFGLDSPADDSGNTASDASPLDLSAGFVRRFATIETAADVDIFRVVAPATGSLLARQEPTAGSDLQAVLTVFDGEGRLIATDFDSSFLRDRTGSVLQWDVVAGGEYFILAAGFQGSIGGYDLSLFAGAVTDPAADDLGAGAGAPAPDDFGDDFAAAPLIPLDTRGFGSQAGAIGGPQDVDAFRFVAPVTGLLRIRMDADSGSRLDSTLFAFDDSGSLLAQDDDINWLTGSAQTLDRNSLLLLGTEDDPVVAGKAYFLKATGFGSSTGRYQVSIAVLRDNNNPGQLFDDVRDTRPADPINEDLPTIEVGTVSRSQMAAIDSIGDVDVFRVVARATGRLTARQVAAPGSGLDSFLEAYTDRNERIASNNDAMGTRDGVVQFNVTTGRVYILQAGAYGGFTASGPNIGQYTLRLIVTEPTPDEEVGDTFATAAMLALPPSMTLDVSGLIDSPGDADVFQFTAPAEGTLAIRQVGVLGDGLDSFLEVFDGTSDLIASNDDTTQAVGRPVQVGVEEGQKYFVRAAGLGLSTGRYLLSFRPGTAAPPDEGNAFAGARRVDFIGKPLTATAFGSIELAGDADMFRFVAPVAGPLMIRQESTADSGLDSFLLVYDDQRRLIADNDDTGPLADAAVVISVARDQVIYVRATSSARQPGPLRHETGAYRLVVTSLADDFDEARANVAEVPTAGTIEVPGDMDLFEFVAPATGRLPVLLQAAPGSGLVPVLVAFDDHRVEIARDYGATAEAHRESRVQLGVTAGQRYFLRASGYGTTTGRYLLSFAPVAADDLGTDFASATPLPLTESGVGVIAGTIEDAGDVDVFRLEAPADRQLVVELTPASGSSLVTDIRVFTFFDGIPTEVASDRVGPGGLVFDVEGSRTYFVRVASAGDGSGGYRLAIRMEAPANPFVSLREAGKATFLRIRDSFSREVSRIGPAPGDAERAAEAISDELVERFLASLDGPPTINYLLLWLDPVDFQTTDPRQRLQGYTGGRGAINERGRGFYSGDGVLELLILPEATVGSYPLELIGVGTGQVLYGARLISAGGGRMKPSGPLPPVNLGPNERLTVSIDFKMTETPAPWPGVVPRPVPIAPTPIENPPAQIPGGQPRPAPIAPAPIENPPAQVPGGQIPPAPIAPAPIDPPPAELPGGPGHPETPGTGPPTGPPAAPSGGRSSSGRATPERTVTEGRVAALEFQIQAEGGRTAGVDRSAGGNSAATGGIVITVVPVRLVPGQTLPGRDSGSSPGGASLRPTGDAASQAVSSWFHSLRNVSASLRKALLDAWAAFQDTVSAFLRKGGSPAPTAGRIEGIEGSSGGPGLFEDRVGRGGVEIMRVLAGWLGLRGDPTPAPPRGRGVAAPAQPEGLAGLADPGAGADAPGDVTSRREEPAAELAGDAGGRSWSAVVILVLASSFGLIRLHRPQRHVRGRALSRRGGGRRQTPTRP
jgi:hypothetical protein